MGAIYEGDVSNKILDLRDSIFSAQSNEVMFARLIPRGEVPTQMLVTWPVEKLPNRGFGGVIDGEDVTDFDGTTRDSLEAYAMEMNSNTPWRVTARAQVVKEAGVKLKGQVAKQILDDGKLFAIQMEQQMLSNLDTAAEAGETASRSRGALRWLDSSAQGVKPVNNDYRPNATCRYTSALNSLTSTGFEDMVDRAAADGRMAVNLVGIVGRLLRKRISRWALADTIEDTEDLISRRTESGKKLVRMIDFLEFSSGNVRMMPTNYHIARTEASGAETNYSPRSGVFVDLKKWDLGYLMSPTAYSLPDLGGGPRGFTKSIYILRCKMPLGQFSVYTNTDSA